MNAGFENEFFLLKSLTRYIIQNYLVIWLSKTFTMPIIYYKHEENRSGKE